MKKCLMLTLLLSCLVPAFANEAIPEGKLGFQLGSYLAIEGVRADESESGARTLIVDTINGKKLDRPVRIWITNIDALPNEGKCILRGYESGRMIGVPEEVAKAEDLPLPQLAWRLQTYFIATSVVQPRELAAQLKKE